MNKLSIDLNADLGEGYTHDEALMQVVTSVNICSGAYIASDKPVKKALALAAKYEVRVGIHVGYPDIEGFGRRAKFMSPSVFKESLEKQVQLFLVLAKAAGVEVNYLKPHGALYHDLIPESNLWDILFKVCEAHQWPILHLANSPLLSVAVEVAGGVNEAFVDRRYEHANALVDRSEKGAVITEEKEVLAQAVSIAQGQVTLQSGALSKLTAQSLCLHGDTQGALNLGKRVRAGLEENSLEIASFL